MNKDDIFPILFIMVHTRTVKAIFHIYSLGSMFPGELRIGDYQKPRDNYIKLSKYYRAVFPIVPINDAIEYRLRHGKCPDCF